MLIYSWRWLLCNSSPCCVSTSLYFQVNNSCYVSPYFFRIRPSTTDYSGEFCRPTSSQQNQSTNSSSRSIIPAGGAVPAARDKPQVKSKCVVTLGCCSQRWFKKMLLFLFLNLAKSLCVAYSCHPIAEIAPMMAKTIKAFKNRFSRR